MVGWQVLLNILIILVFELQICFADTKTIATSGPYKSLLLGVENCTKLSKPYMNPATVTSVVTAYNISENTYLSLNVSFIKETSNIKIKLTSYVMEHNKWIPTYFLNDFGCRGIILATTLAAIGIKYDYDKCMYSKGYYYFPKVDFNALQHLWIKKVEYGMTKWKSDVTHRLGTIFCSEFYVKNVPAEN